MAAPDRDNPCPLQGGVFSERLIRYRIDDKIQSVAAPLATRPHSCGYCMYYNV